MKAVILAGGRGSRLSEETSTRPKPMVEIGERPILWHIMKIYSAHGVNDFVICLGYKGYLIKEYFSQYRLHTSDVTIDIGSNSIEIHANRAEPWRITLIDTGTETETGGRLKRAIAYVKNEEAFCMTYGDGLSDVDIGALVAFHKQHKRLATVTGVRPPGRFGNLHVQGTSVGGFAEKVEGKAGWINGGFFVLNPGVVDFITGDPTIWEGEPLERLAAQGQLQVFFHEGFWQPMDTLRDRTLLENLWKKDNPPWRVWS
jgi:glucose-1-phosphate cytidylyltransferase